MLTGGNPALGAARSSCPPGNGCSERPGCLLGAGDDRRSCALTGRACLQGVHLGEGAEQLPYLVIFGGGQHCAPASQLVAAPGEQVGGLACFLHPEPRSEERRVGKECRSRWS